MLQNRKSRILFFVLIVLTIINLAAVATLMVQIRKFNRMADAPEQRNEAAQDSLPLPMGPGRLMDELGFDDAQRKAFTGSRMAFRDKAIPLFEEVRKLNLELATEISKDVADTVKMRSISRKIGDVQVQLKLLTIEHMRQVKALATPGQQEKLGQFYRDILSRDGRPPGKGMQHRHRHGRGGR